jgi:protein-tyrosine phosphatase
MSELAVTRHLPLPGTFNFRDAGGYPLTSGGWLALGRLYRSDTLAGLDAAGRAALTERGVRTLVDLREAEERSLAPDALDGVDVRVAHHPLYGGRLARRAPTSLEQVYQQLVDDCGDALAAAVAELAAPGALPALVHCTAGKDRTGIVIALVHAVAGVSDADIADDYARTSQYMTASAVAAMSRNVPRNQLGGALGAAALACPPEMILGTLARIRDRSGSVEDYLIARGARADLLAALRAALTTSQPEQESPA